MSMAGGVKTRRRPLAVNQVEVLAPAPIEDVLWCPLCDLVMLERELLDGEACPRCKLVLPGAEVPEEGGP